MNPYDRIVDQYAAARRTFGPEKRYVDVLLDGLTGPSEILDLGCGTGVPIARHLVERGHRVTGIDSSREMLTRARAQVPTGNFIEGRMETVELSGPFDAIVAWDSIFHVERKLHPQIFERCLGWLRPCGPFLLSLGGQAWEGTAEMFGEPFFYSGHAPADAIGRLAKAGFVVERWEVDDPSSRGHIVVLARRAPAQREGGDD